MKHNKWFNLIPLVVIIVIFLTIFTIPYIFYYRSQLAKFYQKINNTYNEKYWKGTVAYKKLIFHTKLIIGDVVVYPDQYSGNLYVINAKGDTIFKYIKKKQRMKRDKNDKD